MSNTTQNIYQHIKSLISLPAENYLTGLTTLEKMLAECTDDDLCKLNKQNDSSLLTDTLSLPFTATEKDKAGREKSTSLLQERSEEMAQLLMKRLTRVASEEHRVRFILIAQETGATLFHKKDFWKNTRLTQFYLALIQQAISDSQITRRHQLLSLLAIHPETQNTSLHEMIPVAASEVAIQFFDIFQHAVADEVISHVRYTRFFLHANRAGSRSIYAALSSAPLNSTHYFAAIQFAHEKKWMLPDECHHLLSDATERTAGSLQSTPFSEALSPSCALESLQAYVQTVEQICTHSQQVRLILWGKAWFSSTQLVIRSDHSEKFNLYCTYIERILTKSQIYQLLTDENNAGFPPIHNALERNPEVFQAFLTMLSRTQTTHQQHKAALIKCSKTGTPLSYALSPKGRHNLKKFWEELTRLDNISPLEAKECQELFLGADHFHIHSLLQVLFTKNIEEIRYYFSEISKYVERMGWKNYAHLFFLANKKGYTPYMEALVSHNPQISALFLEELEKARTHPECSSEINEVRLLLGDASYLECTSLLCALDSKQFEIIEPYFKIFARAVENYPEQRPALGQLLLQRSRKGFPPLKSALKSANTHTRVDPRIATLYLDCVQSFRRKYPRIINNKEYAAALLDFEAPFTSLFFALESGSIEVLERYFRALDEARAEKEPVITEEQEAKLLLTSSAQGSSPLIHLIIAQNFDNFLSYYKRVMALKLSDRRTFATNVLLKKNHGENSPLNQAAHSKDSRFLIYHLNNLKQLFNEGAITSEEYEDALFGANQHGFTPWHDICQAGVFESIDAYLQTISPEYTHRDRTFRLNYRKVLLARTKLKSSSGLDQAKNSCDETTFEWLLKKLREVLSLEDFNAIASQYKITGRHEKRTHKDVPAKNKAHATLPESHKRPMRTAPVDALIHKSNNIARTRPVKRMHAPDEAERIIADTTAMSVVSDLQIKQQEAEVRRKEVAEKAAELARLEKEAATLDEQIASKRRALEITRQEATHLHSASTHMQATAHHHFFQAHQVFYQADQVKTASEDTLMQARLLANTAYQEQQSAHASIQYAQAIKTHAFVEGCAAAAAIHHAAAVQFQAYYETEKARDMEHTASYNNYVAAKKRMQINFMNTFNTDEKDAKNSLLPISIFRIGHPIVLIANLVPTDPKILLGVDSDYPYHLFELQFSADSLEAKVYGAQSSEANSATCALFLKTPLKGFTAVNPHAPPTSAIQAGFCHVYLSTENNWIIIQEGKRFRHCQIQPLLPSYIIFSEEGRKYQEELYVGGLLTQWPEGPDAMAPPPLPAPF